MLSLAVAEDERPGARKEFNWTTGDEPEVLSFTLGGREIWRAVLDVQTLATPCTKVLPHPGGTPPNSDYFPLGTQAAVILAQPVGARLPRLSFPPRRIRYVASCAERYFVSLEGSFENYLAKFGAKARYNLLRTVRRFHESSGGEIRLDEMRSPEELREFCARAIQLSRHSWQERLGGPGFPASENFGARMVELAARGLARGEVLFHGDRPVAYALCRARDDCLLFARTGYDESYAAWSPGRVLLFLLVKRLFQEQKYRYLDLGEGTLPYKRFFATGRVPLARVIYFRRNAWNLAVVLSHWSLSGASRSAGRILQAFGVKRRLKYLLLGPARRPGQWDSHDSGVRPQRTR